MPKNITGNISLTGTSNNQPTTKDLKPKMVEQKLTTEVSSLFIPKNNYKFGAEHESDKTEQRLHGLSQEDIRLTNKIFPASKQFKVYQREYTDDQVTYDVIKQHSEESISVKRNSNETHPVMHTQTTFKNTSKSTSQNVKSNQKNMRAFEQTIRPHNQTNIMPALALQSQSIIPKVTDSHRTKMNQTTVGAGKKQVLNS